MIIDISRVLFRNLKGRIPTGIDIVLIKYLEHYKDHTDLFISRRKISFVIPNKYSSKILFCLINNKKLKLFSLLISLICSLKYNLHFKKYDIFLNIGHTGLEKESYFKKVFSCSKNLTVILYDLIPVNYKAYCLKNQSEIHQTRLLNITKYASNVIAISDFVKSEYIEWCEMNHLAPPNLFVNYLGSKFENEVVKRSNTEDKNYYLAVGTIEPRKNYITLLNLWKSEIAKNYANSKLIIVGQYGWMYDKEKKLLSNKFLKDHVIHKEKCSDDELYELYAGCKALIIPSFVEGFGLPALDAAVQKIPVIASNIEVFKEFLGDYPIYFDPNSQASLFNAIQKIEKNYTQDSTPDLPNWEKHFFKLSNIIYDE